MWQDWIKTAILIILILACIKIARRNINNLRYADDATLMAESEEELKSLLIKVKEESGKAGLKLNVQKMKIMESGPIRSDQIRSVAQSCLTLCDPMNRSTPGLPVHHQHPEFTQTHVHRVSDAIQPSHPLSSPSPPAPNPSQHQRPIAFFSYFPFLWLILCYISLTLARKSCLAFKGS